MAIAIDSGLNALKSKSVNFKVATIEDAPSVSSASANLGTIVFAKSTDSSGADVSTNPAAIYVNGVKVAETNTTLSLLDHAYQIGIEKTTTGLPDGIASRYTISLGGSDLATTIDVLKDNVIADGEVTTPLMEHTANPSITSISYGGTIYNYDDDNEKNIKFLKLNLNTGSSVYILVSDLVDVYTAKDTSEINMTVSDSNEISASIITGSIAKGKLASAVQTSLGKADSAVLSVSLDSGTNHGTLKLTVGSTTTDNILVKGIKSGAYYDVGDDIATIPLWAAKYGSTEAQSATVPFTWPVALSVSTVGSTVVGALTTHAPSKLELSSNNGKIKYTNEVGTEYDIAVKGLASAAYKTAGTASGNVPTLGVASTSKPNYPVLFNSSGALIAGTDALGTAAYKADTYFATATALSTLSETLTNVLEESVTDIAEGSNSGYIKYAKGGNSLNYTEVKVHGLGSAAYTSTGLASGNTLKASAALSNGLVLVVDGTSGIKSVATSSLLVWS